MHIDGERGNVNAIRKEQGVVTMLRRARMADLESLGRLPGGNEFKLRPEEQTPLLELRLEERLLAEGTKAVT